MATPRHRHEEYRVNAWYRWDNYSPSGKFAETYYNSGVQNGSYREINDWVTPGFKRLCKGGGIFLNPLYIYQVDRQVITGEAHQGPYSYWGGYGDVLLGDLVGNAESTAPYPVTTVDSVLNTLGNDVLLKALAEANAPTVLSGEIVADLGKTVAMLKKPAEALRKVISKIVTRKSSLLRAKTYRDGVEAAAAAWLEHRYAMRPLILDVEALVEVANDKSQRRFGRRVARARRRVEYIIDTTSPSRTVGGSWLTDLHSSGKTVGSVDAGVLYEFTNRTTVDQLGGIFGTRASDLPSTIWEAIPYSFVADWFGGFGNWIRAITPNPEIVIHGNWITGIAKTQMTRYGDLWRYVYIPSQQLITGSLGSSTYEITEIRRLVNQPVSPPQPLVTMTALRSADAVALTISRIKGDLRGLRH